MSVILSCGRILARSECLALRNFLPQPSRAGCRCRRKESAAVRAAKQRLGGAARVNAVYSSSLANPPQPTIPLVTEVQAAPWVPAIDLIVGPMFAGKSTELLRRVRQHEAMGRRVLLIKSRKDDRYHEQRVVTHDGQAQDCISVHALADVLPRHRQEYREAQVIAIDEAQFFPDLVDFCTAAADSDDKLVLVAGLDGDFMRQQFGQVGEVVGKTASFPIVRCAGVLQLLPLSDSIVKLSSRCKFCEREARFSMRISADITNQELVGGAESYAPVCRRHYHEYDRSKLLESSG